MKYIWKNPTYDNELTCRHEIGNAHDVHAVAIKKDIAGEVTTVGHILRNISSVCSVFIRCGGIIYCTVNRHKYHSFDLPQGV